MRAQRIPTTEQVFLVAVSPMESESENVSGNSLAEMDPSGEDPSLKGQIQGVNINANLQTQSLASYTSVATRILDAVCAPATAVGKPYGTV